MAARLAKAGGVDQESPEVEAVKRNWPRWMRELVQLAAVGEDGLIGPILRYDLERVWCGSPRKGMTRSDFGQTHVPWTPRDAANPGKL